MLTINKILIIDDNETWRNQFVKILKALGDKHDFIAMNMENFFKTFDSTDKFNLIEYCFVDLELLGGSSSAQIDDESGLKFVLPHIKRLAPWLPVACISRYITGGIRIIADLSLSDFDGFFPKSMIQSSNSDKLRTAPEFNINTWNEILNGLHLKRIGVLTSRAKIQLESLLEKKTEIEFRFSEEVKTILDKNNISKQNLQEGLVLMNFGGTTISMDKIMSGFSGVYATKVSSYRPENKTNSHSSWILKWGDSIRKLNDEANAHRVMFQRGLDRSLQIPQFYSNVLTWKGLGFIAYGFEENAHTAMEYIQLNGIDSFENIINTITDKMYSSSQKDPINPKEELEKWCKFDSSNSSFILSGSLKENFEISATLIRGDFHIRNILIKEDTPTLIDFAKSGYGPIAIDAAKIVIDILVFCKPEEISDKIYNFDFLVKNSSLAVIAKVLEQYLNAKDDILFFEYALKVYANNYLKYPDVPDHVKDNISSSLNLSD